MKYSTDYHAYDTDSKNDVLQNNTSEASASIKIEQTANVKKSINPSKQYDSEGMCLEE